MTPPAGRTRVSLAPYFPLPLVGAAVLLAVLILLTPNLVSTGSPSAGSIGSQAELLVDRAPGGPNVTHLYLRGFGLARYAYLQLAWVELPNGTAPATLDGRNAWSSINASGVLDLDTATSAPFFGINASADYVDANGAEVRYTGEWAFAWTGDVLLTTTYGASVGPFRTGLDQLPLVLFLVEHPVGSVG